MSWNRTRPAEPDARPPALRVDAAKGEDVRGEDVRGEDIRGEDARRDAAASVPASPDGNLRLPFPMRTRVPTRGQPSGGRACSWRWATWSYRHAVRRRPDLDRGSFRQRRQELHRRVLRTRNLTGRGVAYLDGQFFVMFGWGWYIPGRTSYDEARMGGPGTSLCSQAALAVSPRATASSCWPHVPDRSSTCGPPMAAGPGSAQPRPGILARLFVGPRSCRPAEVTSCSWATAPWRRSG